jgi:hypothetical protein
MLPIDFDPEETRSPDGWPERLASIWRGWLLEGAVMAAGGYVYFDLARLWAPGN